jgi:hypothetical protein
MYLSTLQGKDMAKRLNMKSLAHLVFKNSLFLKMAFIIVNF